MKSRTILLLFFILAVTSCSHDHGHDHADHDEAEEMEALVYTIYSEKTELFVEFQPLIIGQECKFAAHFTILGELFKPISEGTITLSLRGDNGNQSISADKPEIPGIFRLRMTPKNAGTYTLVFDIKTPSYTDTITIENVKVYTDEKSAMADTRPEAAGGDITYLKEQAWKTEFANMPVKRQTFYEVISTGGQILPAPGDEVIISAATSGIVFFNSGNLAVGSDVSKGSSMFIISGKGLTENGIDTRFRQAQSDYEKAKGDYERASALVKDKAISEKEFQEKKNLFETAQSAFHAVSQNYTSNGTGISSPISGFVKNIYITEGQYVEMGQPLASVSQNRKLVLHADVSQKYYSRLSSVRSANFVTPDNKAYNTDELNGKLPSYGKSANATGGFIPVTFEIDNKGEILPGSFAEVFLKTTPIADALVIPVSALIEEQGIFYVYVQEAGESFSKREVQTAGNDGINVRILSGVTEGERVVTRGAYNIRLSVASGTLPAHGHEH